MSKKETGKNGEDIAENLLTSQNYEIISKNYNCRFGEIDIVAIDYSKRKEFVFVEVKTRTNSLFGEPQESVDYRKRRKILKTIRHFFTSKKMSWPWRIDVIAIKLERNGEVRKINHYKNI